MARSRCLTSAAIALLAIPHILAAQLETPQKTAATEPTPREQVAAITAAIDQGRGDSLRRQWEAKARRAPGNPAPQFALATLDRLEYHHKAAEDRFAAIALLPGSSAAPWRTWALLGSGLTHLQRWDGPAALALMERALVTADSLGDGSALALALLAEARIAARSGAPDSVRRLIARAQQLAPASDSAVTALVLCAAGATLRLQNTAAADSVTRLGIAMARSAADARTLAGCLLALYQVLEASGRQADAVTPLTEALEVIDRTGDFDLAAFAHQQTAFRYVSYSYGLGNSRVHALRAIALGRRSGNRVAQAYAGLNLAQLAVRLGDLREASRQVDAARILLAALADRPGLAAADFVAGDAAFSAGRLPEAAAAFQRSLEGYQKLGSPVAQITLRLTLLAIERGRLDEAGRLLDDASAEAERIGAVGVKADRVYYEGLIALRRGEGANAAALFRSYREKLRPSAFAYRLDAGLREAEALSQVGRLTEAERRLDSSFAMIEGLRDSVSDDRGLLDRDIAQALVSSRRFEFDPDLGLATTIQRLVAGGRVASALRIAEAERARSLWTRMTQRGLLGRDSATARPRGRIRFPAQLGIEELESAIDSRTAIVEFTTGAGGEPTTVFVLDHRQLRAYAAPPADSLAGSIARFADLVAGGSWPRPLARTLGRLLLDSAVAALPPSVERLILVPDGPLYRLPFDVVLLQSGHPLVERYAVTIAPSVRLAAEWLRDRGAETRPGRVIAFGDARFEAGAGLPRLIGSGEEALVATGRGSRGQAFLGEAASEAALKRGAMDGASILHLATHARTEDWGVLTSAVYLSPGDGEDGRVGPEEISGLTLPIDLVVLSGCHTSGGMVVFGEGIQGLVTPFLEAGARAVVATYWEVRDRQIVPMVSLFYKELAVGRAAGDALHAAKLAAYRAGDPPSRWAALSLTGDPDVRPLSATAR